MGTRQGAISSGCQVTQVTLSRGADRADSGSAGPWGISSSPGGESRKTPHARTEAKVKTWGGMAQAVSSSLCWGGGLGFVHMARRRRKISSHPQMLSGALQGPVGNRMC